MKSTLPLSLFAVIAVLALSGFVRSQTDLSAAKLTKTETMLKEISADYTRPDPAQVLFVVPYAGKELKSIPVLVIEAEAAVVFMADVAAAKDVELSAVVMRKLLEYNMKADYIKVGIGDKGSIVVGCEQDVQPMNSALFQKLLDQVAAGADEVAKILAPARKKAATK